MKRWICLALLVALALIKVYCADKTALPNLLARWTTALGQQIIERVETQEMLLALSFEDGPDPMFTPQILDILAVYGVRATFFVTGRQVLTWPEFARRIAAEGHELANHTYHHPDQSEMHGDRLYTEILATSEAIRSVSGTRPTLFRPPEGLVNAEILELCFSMNYTIVNWTPTLNSCDLYDSDSEALLNRLCEAAMPGGIILLHDHGGNRETTVHALPALLHRLQEKGYELITISDMIRRAKRPSWLPEFY